MAMATRLAFLFSSLPMASPLGSASPWRAASSNQYRPRLVYIHIILSVSLTNIFPIVRMHFGILCQQVVFALTGRHVRMCTEVRVEYVLRHMPKYGIKMIVEPELWNSLGRLGAAFKLHLSIKKNKNGPVDGNSYCDP